MLNKNLLLLDAKSLTNEFDIYTSTLLRDRRGSKERALNEESIKKFVLPQQNKLRIANF